MPSRKIEDFAMIGDCETAALVGRDGAVEWLCWPNFASDACFASFLALRATGAGVLHPPANILKSHGGTGRTR